MASGNTNAQSTRLAEKFNELFKGKTVKAIYFKGYLDKTLEVEMLLGMEKESILGYISYAANQDIKLLDGRQSEDGIVNLYEFDDNSRVTATIIGPIHEEMNYLQWFNSDYSMGLSLTLSAGQSENQAVLTQYSELNGRNSSKVILRNHLRQMSLQNPSDINLRWMDYKCQGQDCYEIKTDVKLSNPIEFKLDVEQGNLLIYPTMLLTRNLTIRQANRSYSEFDFFYSFNYPIIDQAEFDHWISNEINRRIEIGKKMKTPDVDSETQTSDRFKNRVYGDFFISVLSDELISGLMFFNNSKSGRMETVSFNYDRLNNNFYKLGDFFKKDFDYSFFLKRYLEKKKRSLIYREKKIIRDLLEDEHFTHYALTPAGIAFFTDFNVVFGRRHMMVPYEEIESFIDNKALKNYIKK